MPGRSPLATEVKMRIRRRRVLERIHGKSVRVMARAGAFGMKTMRNMIRPPKSDRGATQQLRGSFGPSVRGRRATIHTVNKWGTPVTIDVAVPVQGFGRVIDLRTGRPVSTEDARKARMQLRGVLKGEGAGKPPRRGPSDRLRRFTIFDVVEQRKGVRASVGPHVFTRQPHLVGVKDVPELLEFGGHERIAGELVKYEPHPYVEPTERATLEKMPELIAQTRF